MKRHKKTDIHIQNGRMRLRHTERMTDRKTKSTKVSKWERQTHIEGQTERAEGKRKRNTYGQTDR